MRTRAILIWHNNGEEYFYFTVNPELLTVSRPNCNRVETLAVGGEVNLWGGRGLREVRFTTFLPSRRSPFYDGTDSREVLRLLRAWQDSGDPVRMIVSESDVNDAFLIEDVSEGLREGDGDVRVTLHLREYKFPAALGSSSTAAGAAARPDERAARKTWTVRRGDTLWDIACTLYGDGTRWREIARKNAVTDPRKLPVGQVLTL